MNFNTSSIIIYEWYGVLKTGWCVLHRMYWKNSTALVRKSRNPCSAMVLRCVYTQYSYINIYNSPRASESQSQRVRGRSPRSCHQQDIRIALRYQCSHEKIYKLLISNKITNIFITRENNYIFFCNLWYTGICIFP